MNSFAKTSYNLIALFIAVVVATLAGDEITRWITLAIMVVIMAAFGVVVYRWANRTWPKS